MPEPTSTSESEYAFPGSTPFIARAKAEMGAPGVNPGDVQKFPAFQRMTNLLSQASFAPTEEARRSIAAAAAAELPAFEVALAAAELALNDVVDGLGLRARPAAAPDDEKEEAPE